MNLGCATPLIAYIRALLESEPMVFRPFTSRTAFTPGRDFDIPSISRSLDDTRRIPSRLISEATPEADTGVSVQNPSVSGVSFPGLHDHRRLAAFLLALSDCRTDQTEEQVRERPAGADAMRRVPARSFVSV